MERKKKNEADGFSFVEMLIAMAITAIVLSALIALLAYSMRSMNRTQAQVELQNEAKDVLNHISGYVREGNHVTWEKDKKLLIVEKDKEEKTTDPVSGKETKKVKKEEWYYYYLIGGNLYFKNVTDGDTALTAEKKNLLAENVDDFVAEPDEKEYRVVHVFVKLKDEISEFENKQDVYIRNGCKGGGAHENA